ncbi:MAG: BBE domain-containing protein [Candidatus Korobacteraceae bacterium]
MPAQSIDELKSSFPGDLRLAEIKKKYDPKNFFR